MIRWNIRPHMERRGWTNASQLATGAGLTYPVASRLLSDEPVARIDVATLEKLATALKAKPFSLLTHTK